FLLTGRTPFDESSVARLLERVRTGDFPSPRQVDHRVHPALDAICLRAMALLPENRYATARGLAEDIEHWLADEPVSALRESGGARLARWPRRHRAGVQAGAAGLLLVTAVSVASVLLIDRARRGEREGRREADQKRRDADGRRREADGLAAHLVLDRALAL